MRTSRKNRIREPTLKEKTGSGPNLNKKPDTVPDPREKTGSGPTLKKKPDTEPDPREKKNGSVSKIREKLYPVGSDPKKEKKNSDPTLKKKLIKPDPDPDLKSCSLFLI